MNKKNIHKYAYTAGCIDCDGWITLKKSWSDVKRGIGKSPRYHLTVGLNNKDGRVVQYLQGVWGGNIYYRESHSESGYFPDSFNYTWAITSSRAKELLKKILPFLQYKKDQAEIAIRLQNRLDSKKSRGKQLTKNELQKREYLYQECKRLKKVYKVPMQVQRLSGRTSKEDAIV